MPGILKLVATVAVIVAAGLAMLLVFDIIPPETFSSGLRKTVLITIIFALASAAIAFITRIGR